MGSKNGQQKIITVNLLTSRGLNNKKETSKQSQDEFDLFCTKVYEIFIKNT